MSNSYKEYIEIEGVLYKVYNEELDDGDHLIASPGEDGKIVYDLYYYNGGASF